jgi:predicted DNA-binding protein
MGKPQIAIRMPPSLLQELNNYVELTGMSKTDVVVSAISQYLGCGSDVALSQRVAELELQMKELRALVKS